MPVEVNVGVVPEMRFPFASLRVIVTVALALPSALMGPEETASVERAADGAPATKVTDRCGNDAILGEARETVRVSARVDARRVTKVPEESVVPLAELREVCAEVPEVEPEADKLTARPDTGFPLASLRVIVNVA